MLRRGTGETKEEKNESVPVMGSLGFGLGLESAGLVPSLCGFVVH